MMLTTSNLVSAIPTNQGPKQTIKHTQIVKNQHSLMIFASTGVTIVTLLYDVLDNKPVYIVDSYLILVYEYDAQPKTATHKIFKVFSKLNKVYRANVLVLLMFHHKSKTTILRDNHFLHIRLRPQGNFSLHLIIKIDLTNLITVVPDTSPQKIVKLFFSQFIYSKISFALHYFYKTTLNQ